MKKLTLFIVAMMFTLYGYSQLCENNGASVGAVVTATGQTVCASTNGAILTTICEGDQLCFTIAKTNATNYWDVLDGSTCNPVIVQTDANTFCCTYNIAGMYAIHYTKVQHTSYIANDTLYTLSSPTVFVEVIPRPDADFIINPNPVCINQNVNFENTSTNLSTGSVSTIYFGDGSSYTFTTLGGPYANHSYPTAGTYNVCLEVVNGECKDIVCKPLVVQAAQAQFSNTTVCVNNATQFTDLSTCVNSGMGVTWSWTFGDGGTSTLQNPSHTYPASGTYTATLTVTDIATSTVYTISHTVTVRAKPTVSVNSPTICQGQSAILTASGAFTYTWSTGGFGSTITVSPSTTTSYTVTGTNIFGCTNTAVSTVTVSPNPTVTVNSATICSGQNATLTASGASTYVWNPGGYTSNPLIISPSSTTTYTVTGTQNGCTATATSTVTVNPSPTITITPPSASIVAGNSVGLSASGASTYVWTPATGLSSTTVSNPTASPTTTTTYTVTGTAANGCTGTATVTITIVPPQCDLVINYDIPNGTYLSTIWPANTMVGTQTIRISGTVFADANIGFSNCNIIMEPNAKIQLQNTTTFRLTEKTHVYSCIEMWDGIYSSSTHQKIIVEQSSFIEDGLNAIVSENGGQYDISNSIFNKNHTAIHVKNYVNNSGTNYPGFIRRSVFTSRNIPFSTNPSFNLPYLTVLTNLTSYSPSNTKPPYALQKGVYGVNVTDVTNIGINIGDLGLMPDGTSATNTFEGIMCGINAERTILKVYNNAFKNLINPAACFLCTNVSGYGVRAFGNSSNVYNVVIGITGNQYNNTFYDCYRAIDIVDYTSIEIGSNNIGNSVTAPGTTAIGLGNAGIFIKPVANNYIDIQLNDISNCKTGIWINRTGTGINSNQILISDNTIAANASGYCNNAINLSDASNSGSTTPVDKIKIQYNNITQVYNCINAVNVKNSLVIRSNSQLQLRNNGTAVSAIRLQNCNGAKVHDNQNITIFPVASPVTSTNINFKGIYVITSTASQITCNKISDMGESMVFQGLCASSVIRNNTLDKGNRGLVLRTNGEIGSQGNFSLPCGIWWPSAGSTFTAHTYTDATANANMNSTLFINNTGAPGGYTGVPTINSNAPLSTAYSVALGGLISTFGSPINCNNVVIQMVPGGGGENQMMVEETSLLSTSTIDANEYPVYEQEHKYSNKKYAFEVLDTLSNIIDSDLQHFYDSTKQEAMGKLKQVDDAIKTNDLATVNTLNNAVFASNLIEENQKAFNELYLLYLNDESYMFSEQEKTTLFSIAQQCPLEGGNAVWQSRVLYSTIENDWIEFENNCDATPRKMITENENSIVAIANDKFKLYPNPNNGQMVLEYSIDETENGILFIYDLTGKIIAEHIVNSKNKSLLVNESELEAGIYFYQIKINDKILKKDKLIILK